MKKLVLVFFTVFIALTGCTPLTVNEQVKTQPVVTKSTVLGNVSWDLITSRLGFDENLERVVDIFYFAGTYYSIDEEDSIFSSKDLKSWKLIKKHFDGYIDGDKSHVVLITDNKIEYSNDGDNWKTKKIKNLKPQKVVATLGSLVIQTKLKREPLIFDGFKIIFSKQFYDLYSDNLGLYYRVFNRKFLVSTDSINWVKAICPFKFDEFTYIETIQVNETQSIFTADRKAYEIIKSGTSYEIIEETDESILEQVKLLERPDHQTGDTLIRNANQSFEMLLVFNYYVFTSITKVNNKFFMFGGYGYIYSSEDLKNWSWCGLNKREVLDISKTDVTQFGMCSVSGVYVAYLKDYPLDPTDFNEEAEQSEIMLFTSKDGIKWDVHLIADYLKIPESQMPHDYDLSWPRVKNNQIYINSKSINTQLILAFDENKELKLIETKTDNELHIPPNEEDMKYLGLNGGKIGRKQVEKDQRVFDILRINTDYPRVRQIIYLQGFYYSFTSTNVYRSKNLLKWTKIKWSWPENISYKDIYSLVKYSSEQLIVNMNKKIYRTTDGKDWDVLFDNIYYGTNDIVMAGKTICMLDHNVSKISVKKNLDATLVRLPKDKYSSICTDGRLFAVLLSKPLKGTGYYPIHVSANGIKWSDIKVSAGRKKLWYDLNFQVDFFLYKGKHYLHIHQDDNDDYSYYTMYEIIEKNKGFKPKKLTSANSKKKLSKELSYVDKIFNDNLYGPYIGEWLYEYAYGNNCKFMDDSFMVSSYCMYGYEDYRIFLCNEKELLVGKYGSIFALNEDGQISWAGLYKRKPLDVNEMLDPYKGAVLGFRKFNKKLWYAEFYEKDFSDAFYVASSPDGKSWKFEFTKYSRIAVKSLTEKNLIKFRKNSAL